MRVGSFRNFASALLSISSAASSFLVQLLFGTSSLYLAIKYHTPYTCSFVQSVEANDFPDRLIIVKLCWEPCKQAQSKNSIRELQMTPLPNFIKLRFSNSYLEFQNSFKLFFFNTYIYIYIWRCLLCSLCTNWDFFHHGSLNILASNHPLRCQSWKPKLILVIPIKPYYALLSLPELPY